MHAWSSAAFVSMLWSVWHLPANPPTAKTFLQLLQSIGPFEFQQVVWGPVLSLCARRSRTLVPSAVVHAAGNAYALTMLK